MHIQKVAKLAKDAASGNENKLLSTT